MGIYGRETYIGQVQKAVRQTTRFDPDGFLYNL